MWKLLVLLISLLIVTLPVTAQNLGDLAVLSPENVGELRQIATLGRGSANDLAWRPDGEIIAVAGMEGIWFYDDSFAQTDYWPLGDGPVWQVAWNADGSLLAARVGETLVILRPDGSRVFTGSEPISAFAWHPVDITIVTLSEETGLQILDAETGDLQREAPTTATYDVAWSPDGTRLAASGTEVRIYDAQTLELLRVIDEREAGLDAQWNPDGEFISSYCVDEGFTFAGSCVWNAETGEFVESWEVGRLLWVPDSDNRVFMYTDPTWPGGGFTVESDDGERLSQVGYDHGMRLADWHPDYSHLTVLTVNGEILDVSYPDLTIESVNLQHSYWSSGVEISPDSSRIATTFAGIIYLWDLDRVQDGFLSEPYVAFDTDLGTYTRPFVSVNWLDSDRFVTRESVWEYTQGSLQVVERDAATGEALRQLMQYIAELSSAYCDAWPSWDYELSACEVDDEVFIYSFDSSYTDALVSFPALGAGEIAWRSDNTTIAIRRLVQRGEEQVFRFEIRDVSDGSLLYDVDAGNRWFMPAWNSDLGLVAVSALVDENSVIQIVDTVSYEIVDSVTGRQALWHPDTDLLAVEVEDGMLGFWTPDAGLLDIQIETGTVTDFDWSDDGRFIAIVGDNGRFHLWGMPQTDS